MSTSSDILHIYLLEQLNSDQPLNFDADRLLELTYKHKGGDFLTPLSYYRNVLESTDKVMIPYLDEERKKQLTHDLQIAILLLLVQIRYESKHQKTENQRDYVKQIKRCAKLLDALNPELQAKWEKAPEQEYFTDGTPIKYCGITLSKEFAQQLFAMMDRKSKTLREYLGALNEKRLYWIWGSSFIKTMLSLVPEDFHNSQNAGEVIKAPDLYTGALSWSLYYFRFSLNFFLALKHTVRHPWMEEEEYLNTTWTERFMTQWNMRKFTLLNDFLWGNANLLCYFWLTGKGVLGTAGDALTIALLIFDLSVALWDFAEQQTQYNAQMEDYNEQIIALDEQRAQLNKRFKNDENNEEYKRRVALIDMQIKSLKQAMEQCASNWELQKLSLYNSIAYAMGLTIAFVMMTMPFMPIAASTAFTLGVVGGVLCFGFTVINNAIKGGIEVYIAREALKAARSNFIDRLIKLQKELIANANLDDNSKRLIYLEIKKLQAETVYQRQVVMLQTAHLVRSVMIEALVPAMIFMSTVFLPLGIGFAAMGAALGLAIGTNILINVLLKPEKGLKKLPPFDEEEYQGFCNEVKLSSEESAPKRVHDFFNSQRKAARLETSPKRKLKIILIPY
jgi:hypothetical protein